MHNRIVMLLFFTLVLLLVGKTIKADKTKKEIIVLLSKQNLYAYENGKEKFKFNIVTGDKDHPTLPGKFYIYIGNTKITIVRNTT